MSTQFNIILIIIDFSILIFEYNYITVLLNHWSPKSNDNKFLGIMTAYLNDNNININLLSLVDVDKRSVTTRGLFDDCVQGFGIDFKIIFSF